MTKPTPDSLLHRLWTKAVGTDNYSKQEWLELEKQIWHPPALDELQARYDTNIIGTREQTHKLQAKVDAAEARAESRETSNEGLHHAWMEAKTALEATQAISEQLAEALEEYRSDNWECFCTVKPRWWDTHSLRCNRTVATIAIYTSHPGTQT